MKYYIVILTDNNRSALQVSLIESSDMQVERTLASMLFDSYKRVIYKEAYSSFDGALLRLMELKKHTRMQTERLIRGSNPNWLNILRQPVKSQIRSGIKTTNQEQSLTQKYQNAHRIVGKESHNKVLKSSHQIS